MHTHTERERHRDTSGNSIRNYCPIIMQQLLWPIIFYGNFISVISFIPLMLYDNAHTHKHTQDTHIHTHRTHFYIFTYTYTRQ